MSKYDEIGTAADMVREVQMHGLSTAQEDLNRVADIFGHSPVKELARLANDIGRNNEYGEPDPKGSWSSNRPATRSTFYMIASNIWNWEEVTRFWNQYSNPEHEQLKQAKADAKTYMSRIEDLEAQLEDQKSLKDVEHQARLDEATKLVEATVEIGKLNDELHSKDMEITALKVKLYDLMTKEDK